MIDLAQVTFQYESNEDSTNGIFDINMSIPKGSCVLLCGKSGCGKTTLSRVFNGLVPSFYRGNYEGKCTFDDIDITKQPLHEIAKRVGSVFQNPKSQFFATNSTHELAFGCENFGIPAPEIQKRIKTVASELHLDALLDRELVQLSGGEKQKIACGSVRATNPDVYVFDEPSANLDIYAIEDLRKILLALKQSGKTIIIAEHRLYYLKDIVDTIYYIRAGVLDKQFKVGELASMPLTERLGFGLRMMEYEQLEAELITKVAPQHVAEQILHIHNLQVQYRKSPNLALNIPDLTLNNQEIVGIIGHNGAGKTTFAHALCGLVKKKAGRVLLNGKELSAKDCLKKGFLVMQDVNYQLFTESVKEELLLNTSNEALFNEVVEHFDFGELLEKHPMALSGGQKQRVAVASAIMSGKELVIFDEPTSGLDLYHMYQVIAMIQKMQARGIGIIIISHDYEFVSNVCHRILHFAQGQLIADFSLEDQAGYEQLRNYFTLDSRSQESI